MACSHDILLNLNKYFTLILLAIMYLKKYFLNNDDLDSIQKVY